MDRNGQHPHATIPGGARQRVLAYRFGTNLVMYALTGNYKGDQVHVPARYWSGWGIEGGVVPRPRYLT
jgi:hypothetical protein